jgi:hypothetical protein
MLLLLLQLMLLLRVRTYTSTRDTTPWGKKMITQPSKDILCGTAVVWIKALSRNFVHRQRCVAWSFPLRCGSKMFGVIGRKSCNYSIYLNYHIFFEN